MITSLIDDHIINEQDKFGRTALHYAAIIQDLELIDLLEKKKADRMIADKFRKTADEYLSNNLTILRVNLSSSSPSFAASDSGSVPLCVKRCFEERCSDSAKYEAELRKMVQDIRTSVDATSFVRNIYSQCRFDYCNKFDKQCQLPTESTISSTTMFAAIHRYVTKAMEYLANEISSEDDRFACKVVPVGSAHEGTNIGFCDEFDYNFVLIKLSRKYRFGHSPESPPGFVLLKASTPDYDEDLFYNNGTLNTRIVKFRFEELVLQVLLSSQFCEATDFEFIGRHFNDYVRSRNVPTKPHSCITLTLISPVNGCHVMHRISVDIVPALQINDWWPEDAQHLCQTGECLIVFTQPQNNYPWIG